MLLFVGAESKQRMENWCMRRCDCNLSLSLAVKFQFNSNSIMQIKDSIFEDPGKKWSHDMLASIACFTVDVTSSVFPQFSTIIAGLTICRIYSSFPLIIKLISVCLKFELLLTSVKCI